MKSKTGIYKFQIMIIVSVMILQILCSFSVPAFAAEDSLPPEVRAEDASGSAPVIFTNEDLMGEVEKIREQVQNIE